MRHVFKAKKLGWGNDKTEGIWFDADDYTKEEAEAEFKPYQGVTQRGYDYTGYEYDGERYHHYTYLGEFEDGDMPTSDADLWKRKLAALLNSSPGRFLRGGVLFLPL